MVVTPVSETGDLGSSPSPAAISHFHCAHIFIILSMSEKLQGYFYSENYPYLQEVKRNSGKFTYRAWTAARAFNEVYFPLDLKPGQKILDVGAGMGNLGNALKIGGIETIGIDINLAALKAGREVFSLNNQINSAADKLPIKDSIFDAVVSQDLFEHLPDTTEAERVFTEMERVCKGNKMLHKITVLEDVDWIDCDDSHMIKWHSSQWKEWFQGKNWEVVASTVKRFPVWSRHKVGLGKMYGYFLLQRSEYSEARPAHN